MSFIYLSSPYIGDEERRYLQTMAYLAKCTKKGEVIFSPIVHCHEMAKCHKLPTDALFWEQWNYNFLKAADKVRILMLPGWKESKGVGYEIAYCEQHNKKVEYAELPV